MNTPASFLVACAVLSMSAGLAQTQSSTIPNHLVRNSQAAQMAGAFGQFGKELADFDGDGFPDYAVAAPNYPFGAAVGRVYIVSGRTARFIKWVDGEQPNSKFGDGAIADIGDVNRDGQRDLAVGAPSFRGKNKASAGKLYVFDGKTGAVLWSRVGEKAGDLSAYRIEALGGTKSTTPPILALTEPGFDSTPNANNGRIVFLNAATGAKLGEARGKTSLRSLGLETSSYPESDAFYVSDSIGDVWSASANGALTLVQKSPASSPLRASLSVVRDGRGALLPVIGRRLANSNARIGNGSVEVLVGTTPLLRITGTRNAHGVGTLVSSTRDIDGDGVEEIAFVRSYNSLNVETVIARLDGTRVNGPYFMGSGVRSLASISDVTGDGRAELVLAIASGLSTRFEARVLAQGMTLEKLKNDPSGFQADYRIAMPASIARGLPYVQLFSISGTSPGVVLPHPSSLLPINFDPVTDAGLALANTAVFGNTIGLLSAMGESRTRCTLSAEVARALRGRDFTTVTALLPLSGLLVTNPLQIRF